ncbi:fasciclin domain-containing protein [Desertivirga brevis]|uniref:fasciclin domain-containing protein n=1 Tax=Desertivirga brevis TaxID=2810310 RepID=UPI001A96F638|nr:fasciclin domain-containing protein [Pedobacter sp. SYSU D00873]
MNRFNKSKRSIKTGLLFCLALLCFISCKKEPIVTTTSDQVNITTFLDKNPDKFSEFRKILEITGTAGYLQAYGTYTLFLPTNEGVRKYLQDSGKSSVEQVNVDSLKDLVRFHLIEDTISTEKFGDGKLNSLTMLDQYLITGATNAGGITKVTVNRQANLEQPNIRLGNGYVHIIDNMLRPSTRTLAKAIEANPANSIFVQALKVTGLYDTLNVLPENNLDLQKKYMTVFVESNSVLASAGITDFKALTDKYSPNATNYTNGNNGLHMWAAYHILFYAKYLADIVSSQGHPTLARPEIVSSQLKNEQVLINDIIFNGTYEPGFLLSRTISDNSAINGVYHYTAPYNAAGTAPTTGHFGVKKRDPFPVYWDVADFPEARKNPSFRKSGAPAITFTKPSATAASPIKGWWWPKTGDGVYYRNSPAGEPWVFGDFLNLFLGNVAGNIRQEFIEMKSPLVVRGKYVVWVCYRRRNQSGTYPTNIATQTRVVVDGEVLPTTFNFGEPAPLGSTSELEALGWKYYTSTGNAASPFLKQTYNASGVYNNNPWISKKVGVVDIKTTDIHTVRLEAVQGTQNANDLDMIHFIPVDWSSQVLPRFKVDGTPDFTPYPGTH